MREQPKLSEAKLSAPKLSAPKSSTGRHASAIPIGYAEYVAILVVVCVLVLGVLILFAPAIAHLLAGLFPHLFAT